MVIHSTDEKLFARYGRVLKGYDTAKLVQDLDKYTPLPEKGTIYVPSDKNLENNPLFVSFRDNIYGGMPIQLGYCNGYNTRLNCLEYHRDSEINMGNEDFILLLAKREEVEDFKLDTSKVVAFKVKKGDLVEVYATTLHYAPCQASKNKGFKVMVVLPKGTNTDMPTIEKTDKEDDYLFARNKWLLAHEEAGEVNRGAVVGLVGENVDIEKDIA